VSTEEEERKGKKAINKDKEYIFLYRPTYKKLTLINNIK